jgi:phosphate/sulfate permease
MACWKVAQLCISCWDVVHDVHKDVAEDKVVMEMHTDAEKFDPRTEEVFKYLQVLSACAMSFSHGANDVANSVGSFAAAYSVYQSYAVPSKNSVLPQWILALGSVGIVVGLATYVSARFLHIYVHAFTYLNFKHALFKY